MKIQNLTRTAMFTALICICSFIRIPLVFTPVPITLQVFAVICTALVLGGKWGSVAVGLYLLLGGLGLPVFSGMQAGLGVLAGPTGGFLWGCLASAYFLGASYKKFVVGTCIKSRVSAAIIIAIGISIIYIGGVIQLIFVTKMSMWQALTAGVFPFILPDIFKAVVAVMVFNVLKKTKLLC